MEHLRIQNLWWPVAFATHVCSISLLGTLQSYSQLSTLESYINGTANLNNLLTNANNFTFLAPTNDAIGKYLSQSDNSTLSTDLLEALVQYSLLKGGYPTLSFSNGPQFVPSGLVNGSYANVTGGQAVELVASSKGTPQIVSGNKNISSISSADIVCTGGIVHIIDDILTIPITAIDEIPTAHLQYFVEILNKGGFLDAANAYVNQVTEIPDVTYFIPNSEQAVAYGNQLIQNTSSRDLQALFEYHVVTGFVGYSPSLKDGMQLKSAQGGNLTITIQDGDMYVNAAKVTTSDYIVANGVVHVIDNLLNPNNTAGPPPPSKPAASKPTTTTPANSPTTATPTPTHSPSSNGLSTGAKAGIGVGAAVGAIILLIGLILCCRKKKVERPSPSWVHVGPSSGTPDDFASTRYGGGQIHRPEMGTTGMQDMHDSTKSSELGSSQPSVPPRSPNHKFVDAYRF